MFSNFFKKKNGGNTPPRLGAHYPYSNEAIETIRQIIDTYTADTRQYKSAASTQEWKDLMVRPKEFLIEAALVCCLHPYQKTHSKSSFVYYYKKNQRRLASLLLRKKLPFENEHFLCLIPANSVNKYDYLNSRIPPTSLMGALEHFGKTEKLTEQLSERLQAWSAACQSYQSLHNVADRIQILLGGKSGAGELNLPSGLWGRTTMSWLPNQSEDKKRAWRVLLAFAATAQNKTKPTQKWLRDCKPLVAAVGQDILSQQMQLWFLEVKPDPKYPDHSLEVLKGLIWACHHVDGQTIASPLGRFTEVCLQKIKGIGARSKKLSNACLLTLADLSPPQNGIAELVRLKTKVKYPGTHSQIFTLLDAAAKKTGIGLAELQERILPDFNLDGGGILETVLGDIKAVIKLEANGARLIWRGADGKIRKTPPVSVKRDYKDELKALKQRVKDITGAQQAQVKLLENSWILSRSWTFPMWKTTFLEHPVRRPLARTLIWQTKKADQIISFMQDHTKFVDAQGMIVKLSKSDNISLWHPMLASDQEIQAWQAFLSARKITQPIKQAWRETYALGRKELELNEKGEGIKSNRFSGHTLRQHQLKSLSQPRDWQYQLQGWFDSWNAMTRHIKLKNIRIFFEVTMVVDKADRERSGIAAHVTTGHFWFETTDGKRLALCDVPPILYSELIRDIDMFVSVANITAEKH